MAARRRTTRACAGGSRAIRSCARDPTAARHAAIRRVVQDEEVADALVQRVGEAIELAREAFVRRRRPPACGSRRSMSWMPFWIRNRLVDSSGSRKPLARPSPTQLRFQASRAAAGAEAQQLGFSISAGPSSWPNKVARASSSLMKRVENTWPLPVRCCSGMRQIQPPCCAIERVNGVKSALRSQGTAQARSQGSHVRPVFPRHCRSLSPSSSERKPLQSTKKSPCDRLRRT